MLNLTRRPKILPAYTAAHGPQTDLSWAFYDDNLVIVTPTLATFQLTVSSGVATGTVTLDGQTFTAQSVGVPVYTVDSFFTHASDARITATNIMNALKANQFTAGRWQLSVGGNASSAVLSGTSIAYGQQLRTTSQAMSPAYGLTQFQGNAGLLRDRFFLAYQGRLLLLTNQEVDMIPTLTVPAAYDFNASEEPFVPLLIDLLPTVRRYLSTPFPSSATDAANTMALVNSAVAFTYIRYGSLEYAGCQLADQDILLSDLAVVVNQSWAQDEPDTTVWTPPSLASGNVRTMNMTADINMPLTYNQYAWIYVYSNLRHFDSTNALRKPAVRYKYYDADGVLIGTSATYVISWSITSPYKATVIRFPVGPANHLGTIPVGTVNVVVEVGNDNNDGSGIFIKQYKAWTYRILHSDCTPYQLFYLGPWGGWESLMFEESIEENVVVEQSTARLAQSRRSSFTDSAFSKGHIGWQQGAGDTQRETKGRRRLKLRTKNLDASDGARRVFEALLTSEDRRLFLSEDLQILTKRLRTAKVLSVQGDTVLRTNGAGKSYYEITIELAESLPVVAAS